MTTLQPTQICLEPDQKMALQARAKARRTKSTEESMLCTAIADGAGLTTAATFTRRPSLSPHLRLRTSIRLAAGTALAGALSLCGCSETSAPVTELKHYPIEGTDGLITQTGLILDNQVTSDGSGSLRITVTEPTTVRLYETGDLDVEDARLTYRAKMRTDGLEGKAYFEMWCQFTGKGEFFSRDLDSPLSGTTDWSTEETSFFLNKGENPDNVKLNLVIDGKGTVWIDDIRLYKGPLK